MKNNTTFFLLILLFPYSLFSQEKGIVYTNTNIFEFFANSETRSGVKTLRKNYGIGLEFSTFHGIFISKKIVLSAGIGIAFSISEDRKGLPAVGEVKWYFYDYGEDSPYISFNTGANIELGSFEKGSSVKLALGYRIENNDDFFYTVEVLAKYKSYDGITVFNSYEQSAIGIALGVSF